MQQYINNKARQKRAFFIEGFAITIRRVRQSSLPVFLRAHTFQTREELAERGGIGKMEMVGYLGDAHLGGLQQDAPQSSGAASSKPKKISA